MVLITHTKLTVRLYNGSNHTHKTDSAFKLLVLITPSNLTLRLCNSSNHTHKKLSPHNKASFKKMFVQHAHELKQFS